MEKKINVFISFSHDSTAHEQRVLALAHRLNDLGGLQVVIDFWDPNPVEGWPMWMDRQVRESDYTLMVCTETYHRRIYGKEAPDKGHGAAWEGNLITNHFYLNKAHDPKFIPVVFCDADAAYIPTPFAGKTRYRVDEEGGIEALYRELSGQPLHERPEPKAEFTRMPPRTAAQLASGAASPGTPPIVSTDHLPHTSGQVFGREAELQYMAAAWEDPGVRVFAYVAQGGEGKTALLRAFLNQMADQGYRGARRVFAWSFYSQGATTDSQASSAEFLRELLDWLGAADWAYDPHRSDYAKAGKVVELLRAERTLLILDGVEPLQHPPNAPHGGELKDRALHRLLRELAQAQPGLCLVTTRLHLANLSELEGHGAVQPTLPPLVPEAGAQVLHALGVKGTPKHLQAASEDLLGHALSLTLLGTLLVRAYHADVQQRDRIPQLIGEKRWGAHAQHILQDYVRWLDGLPALQVLRLMGLFDRPVELGVVKALAQPPAIAGLTEHLVSLSEADWRLATLDLAQLHLIGRETSVEGAALARAEGQPKLDCHPLVREYFALELKGLFPEAWTEAHRRLYMYYKDSAKEYPDTLEEMEPLFRAMGHACKAGLYQEVLGEVYWKRIQREDEYYATKKLGAFSEDLAAIAGLFERPWEQVVGELSEGARGFLLNEAGFCLRALVRLREALGPIVAGREMAIARKAWKNAASAADNLSELRVTIGELGLAVADGRQAVAFADQSGDEFQRMSKRTALADALQQAGEVAEAEELFREAEDLQVKRQPAYPRLYALQGYRFCALLLAKGEWEEVKERAMQTLQWAKQYLGLLAKALDMLSLGRAAHLQALAEGAGDFGAAKGWLDQAVEGLRKARELQRLPDGLLARAALLRDWGAYPAAEVDLQEVEEIARGSEMRLHLCDYHLEMARLCLAVGGRVGEAEGHYHSAEELVAETGYHRRDGELAELRVALGVE